MWDWVRQMEPRYDTYGPQSVECHPVSNILRNLITNVSPQERRAWRDARLASLAKLKKDLDSSK